MAKRFTATEIWAEDWFLEMPLEYKLFWYYMLSTCNHAGIFKVNLRSFCGLNEVKLTPKLVLDYFNKGKVRIREINSSLWLIEEFFVYQYGTTLNDKNRVHNSIKNEYIKYNIELGSIRGLLDLKEGVKDKDKDIVLDKERGLWFLKFYNSNYASYKQTFNGQSTSEHFFNEWKQLIDFIYEKKYTDVFECKFLSPHDYGKIANIFTRDKWDEILRKILSTGIKPEHNLFFRIPEFLKYSNNNNDTSKAKAGSVGKTIEFDKP